MTNIVAIQVNDPVNPVELAIWFQDNPDVIISSVVVNANIFYVIYK